MELILIMLAMIVVGLIMAYVAGYSLLAKDWSPIPRRSRR